MFKVSVLRFRVLGFGFNLLGLVKCSEHLMLDMIAIT